jgi:hypothetical protein
MTFRVDNKAILRGSLAAVVALALLAGSGCSSSAKSGGAAAQDAGSGGGHIDVMCIGDRINSPTESFHYSYKYTDASGSVEKEADITPQAMDITITDGSGSRNFHGVRSNEASWNGAVLDLSGLNITALSARLDSLNGTSSIASQGAQAMNGYSATKYSIDTTSANSSDQKTFKTLFGAGSFEKGTVWMGQDGCMVKLVLDEEFSQTNGGVEKRHYEMARIKK